MGLWRTLAICPFNLGSPQGSKTKALPGNRPAGGTVPGEHRMVPALSAEPVVAWGEAAGSTETEFARLWRNPVGFVTSAIITREKTFLGDLCVHPEGSFGVNTESLRLRGSCSRAVVSSLAFPASWCSLRESWSL